MEGRESVLYVTEKWSGASLTLCDLFSATALKFSRNMRQKREKKQPLFVSHGDLISVLVTCSGLVTVLITCSGLVTALVTCSRLVSVLVICSCFTFGQCPCNLFRFD